MEGGGGWESGGCWEGRGGRARLRPMKKGAHACFSHSRTRQKTAFRFFLCITLIWVFLLFILFMTDPRGRVSCHNCKWGNRVCCSWAGEPPGWKGTYPAVPHGPGYHLYHGRTQDPLVGLLRQEPGHSPHDSCSPEQKAQLCTPQSPLVYGDFCLWGSDSAIVSLGSRHLTGKWTRCRGQRWVTDVTPRHSRSQYIT